MEYWLDGYNVIKRKGWHTDGLERARDRLIRVAMAEDAGICIYFDASRCPPPPGTPSPSRSSCVRTKFVRGGTADDAMLDDLRRVRPGDVTIVTDDRELRGRAKQLGARTVGVDKFVARLERPAPQPDRPAAAPPQRLDPSEGGARDRKLSPSQVDDWMREMDLTPDWQPEKPDGA